MTTQPASGAWGANTEPYQQLTNGAAGTDSVFLREQVLFPTLLELVGDVSHASVLDVGSGTGWFHDRVHAADPHSCDVAAPGRVGSRVTFCVCDAEALCYPDGRFDVVVASLVLQWVPDLDAAFAEMFRVTRPGGHAVVTLTHPYFYRTFELDADGRVTLTRALNDDGVDVVHVGGAVGPFTHTRRNPTDYVNASARVGWRLDELVDDFVDMDAYRAAGVESLVPRTGDVPMFMSMRISRPT